MDNIQQYTEMLYNNYSNNSEIKKLLMYIKSLPNVPIELLAKYYIRVYSIQSNFYTDLNTALRKNQKDKYLIFVKVLYESIKLKAIPLMKEKKLLFRGSIIKKSEIKNIKECINKKIENIPSSIVFSRSFLSFSKSKAQALEYTSFANNKTILEENDENEETSDVDESINEDKENNADENNYSEVLYISIIDLIQCKERYN